MTSPAKAAPDPVGGLPAVVLMVQVLPVEGTPLTSWQSVIEPGPPPCSTALICSTTAWVSMVAVLSTLLRPLLPTAVASTAITESMPKTSTTPAMTSSIRVTPDSGLRFGRWLLVRIMSVPPHRAVPEPRLNAACRRDSDRGPPCTTAGGVFEVIDKAGRRRTHSRGGIARQATGVEIWIHSRLRIQARTPHGHSRQLRRRAGP